VFFLVSAAQAFLLNFFIFFCTRVNSPLVTSVTGRRLRERNDCRAWAAVSPVDWSWCRAWAAVSPVDWS
jgi:hypothetical protein